MGAAPPKVARAEGGHRIFYEGPSSTDGGGEHSPNLKKLGADLKTNTSNTAGSWTAAFALEMTIKRSIRAHGEEKPARVGKPDKVPRGRG